MTDSLDYQKTYLSTVRNIGITFTNELQLTGNNKHRYLLLPQDIRLFDKKRDRLVHFLYDSGFWSIFAIYALDNTDFIETYTFSTGSNASSPNFWLNNISTLEHFIVYFKERAKSLIDTSDKRKLAYFQQSFDFSNITNEDLAAQQSQQFFESTKLKNIIIEGKYQSTKLTQRESECLYYLALGNSIKQIAAILNLSPRTVETYLNHIKQKTGYFSRSALVTKFIKNAPLTFFR